jgi:hypothetical protein
MKREKISMAGFRPQLERIERRLFLMEACRSAR